MSREDTVHAGVALIGEGGVLIRGAPGSGKSSLMLALFAGDHDAALVADDRVALIAANGRLLASVPAEIAGLMEIRGQGVVRRDWVSPVVVDLVVDLAPPDACPRMRLGDDDQHATVAGIVLPRVFVPVGATDAHLRVRAALAATAQERLGESVP